MSGAKARRNRFKVIVVDEDSMRAKRMATELRRNGFGAVTCCFPLKAMGVIRREHPDAVVLEVIMPGRSGFELAARMQADPLFARVPIIFTSDIQNSAGGNHDYFPRPFDMQRLIETLKKRIALES